MRTQLMDRPDDGSSNPITMGIVATVTPATGVLVSLANIEAVLRVACLAISFVAGLLTVIAMLENRKRRKSTATRE